MNLYAPLTRQLRGEISSLKSLCESRKNENELLLKENVIQKSKIEYLSAQLEELLLQNTPKEKMGRERSQSNASLVRGITVQSHRSHALTLINSGENKFKLELNLEKFPKNVKERVMEAIGQIALLEHCVEMRKINKSKIINLVIDDKKSVVIEHYAKLAAFLDE